MANLEHSEAVRPEDVGGPVTRAQIESVMSSIWSRVLNGAVPGLQDDFFELGGDSLAAIKMAAMVRQELPGAKIPVSELSREVTISRLASWVAVQLAQQQQAQKQASAQVVSETAGRQVLRL